MASDNEEIYLGQYDLNARRVIESLTLPRYWDFDQFKGVLVALAKAGNGASIPAPNRPESIHVQSWRQHINKLKQLTGETGREHARAVFADTESGSLVFGKTTRERNVSKSCRKCTCTSWTRNCSRVKWARLSYFLSDKREQAMLMAFGEEYLMIVLKTSATPNNIDSKRVDKRIQDIEREFLNSGKNMVTSVVDINKTVCTEFGLVMYLADDKSRDLLNRVEVTSI